MIKKYIKKLVGIDKIEEEVALATQKRIEAEMAAAEALKAAANAKEEERKSKLSPKDLATEQKEPWVGVLTTHVNKNNIRNGFFELDWNEYFVLELRNAGYFGETEEQVVDAWFCELCKTLGTEAGVDMDKRGSGFVNRALRDDGRTEIG